MRPLRHGIAPCHGHPLASSRMYPLAALVFFASIAVPMLKLFGLTMMLVATADAAVGVATRSNET